MDGEYRQKINIELTESEADCLLTWILSMEKTVDDEEQDMSEMVSMMFARLLGAFPDLMESENVGSFLAEHGHKPDSEDVPNFRALVPRHRMLKQVQLELQSAKNLMQAELAKLEARETLLENQCIKRVLDERNRYATDTIRYTAVGRSLGSDVNYQFVKERKRKIKSELARVSNELAALPVST